MPSTNPTPEHVRHRGRRSVVPAQNGAKDLFARFATAAAWPGPVWGTGAAVVYPAKDLDEIKARLAEAFTV